MGARITKNAAAVVTGAGSGIGRAFALEIARRGGRVICADIDQLAAQETVKQITARRGQAWAVQCDVGNEQAMQSLFETSIDKLGGHPNLVINNAGIGVGGSNIGDLSMDDWKATIDVNLWGVIHGCHLFTPGLRAQGKGGIINVCSAASFAAAPRMSAYNTTKAAVLALSETLAAELAGSGVHVTALCPTFVKTNIVRDGRIDDESSRMAQLIMQWTGVAPDKIARKTLNALERGQAYVVPQFDARLVWRMKRYVPGIYLKGSSMLGWTLNRMSVTEKKSASNKKNQTRKAA